MLGADAEVFLQRLQKQLLAAIEVGRVEPVLAVPGDGDVQVAQERYQAHRAGIGIDAGQHHHVAAAGLSRCVHADEQHGKGVFPGRMDRRGGNEQQRRAKQRRGPLK